jgi:pyruvate kinase
MALAGMDVARLNFSHGTQAEHLVRVNRIKELRREHGVPVALMHDTKGPEIRIRSFAEGRATLAEGAAFTLTTREVPGDAEIVSVTYGELPRSVSPGAKILVDDGMIALTVQRCTERDVVCTVDNGGELTNNKSINIPSTTLDMAYLNDKDRADLRFSYEHDFDFIALSFVRRAQDILDVRAFLAELGQPRSELVAKIENLEGLTNIDEIIGVADGIMVARGDMGVEIPFEELPHIQKTLIKKCLTAGKPVITATQMLESMRQSPRPTRAEITDVANAIYDGTSATMLSGETASGKYPVESLLTMDKIARQTEANIHYQGRFDASDNAPGHNVANAISHATCSTAHDLGAAAIVAVTLSGATARMISRWRPQTRIAVVTPVLKTYYQMSMVWGVRQLLGEFKNTPEALFKDAAAKTAAAGLAGDGDLLVMTGSSSSSTRITNTLQVQILGDVLSGGSAT